MINRLVNYRTEMLPLATAHIAHLCAKAYTGGCGFKPSSLLIRRISLEISSYCAKQKSSSFPLINTKYLIIVNNFLKIWNVLRVRVTFSSVGGGGGNSLSTGLSTKMQNKKNITFLALLILVFALESTKK